MINFIQLQTSPADQILYDFLPSIVKNENIGSTTTATAINPPNENTIIDCLPDSEINLLTTFIPTIDDKITKIAKKSVHIRGNR